MKNHKKLLKILCAVILIILLFFVVKMSVFKYSVSGSGAKNVELVYKEAIQKDDISICDKVFYDGIGDTSTQEIRSSCYSEFVRAHPNQNACVGLTKYFEGIDPKSVEYNVLHQNYTSCVYVDAYSGRNPKTCNQLSATSVPNQSTCIKNVTDN